MIFSAQLCSRLLQIAPNCSYLLPRARSRALYPSSPLPSPPPGRANEGEKGAAAREDSRHLLHAEHEERTPGRVDASEIIGDSSSNSPTPTPSRPSNFVLRSSASPILIILDITGRGGGGGGGEGRRRSRSRGTALIAKRKR